LWGHYGIARELSAFYGLPLKEIAPYEIPQNVKEIEITLEDTARSPRYIGVQIEGLAVKPSPFDIQTRLWRVGLRPINAIVDITNYVMLAVGNPTHAFDRDKIAGHITVRRARDGEKLLLLDDTELTLSAEDLVIADDEGAVGLAGVMGGKRDSVLPETNKIILEIANFEAKGIRRTATRHDARTDAATRYEKGIDPQRADSALAVAMPLFLQIYPEMRVASFRDNFALPLARKEVKISLEWLAKRLGKRLSNEEIRAKLELLGFDVEFTQCGSDEELRAVAPTWRSTGDISIPDDILEELARMHGYENFDAAPISTTFTGAIHQPVADIDRNIREFLAFRCGMREVFTYPWVRDEFLHALYGSPAEGGFLALSAPPAPDEKFLRQSLLPNICKAVAGNVRYMNEFAIFESAQVFLAGEFVSNYDPREKLPVQRRNVAGAIVGSPDDVNNLFRRTKGALEALPRQIHCENFTFERREKPHYADNTVWLNIVANDTTVGSAALLSKKSALACGIKNHAVMLFELDIDALVPLASRDNKFTHLPEFPVNEYDQSLLFDANTKWTEIEEAITAKKGELFRGVSFVDEYRGKQIPDGKKSVTFRLLLGSNEKTLNSSEIENFANSVVKRLTKQLGAETRSA
jgi:phenylalanyl-tRNA synthetase beta chain